MNLFENNFFTKIWKKVDYFSLKKFKKSGNFHNNLEEGGEFLQLSPQLFLLDKVEKFRLLFKFYSWWKVERFFMPLVIILYCPCPGTCFDFSKTPKDINIWFFYILKTLYRQGEWMDRSRDGYVNKRVCDIQFQPIRLCWCRR